MNHRFSVEYLSGLLNERRRESKSSALALIALLTLVSLTQTACGQKGDLYLPDAKPATPAK
jgi:hypothetical protein